MALPDDRHIERVQGHKRGGHDLVSVHRYRGARRIRVSRSSLPTGERPAAVGCRGDRNHRAVPIDVVADRGLNRTVARDGHRQSVLGHDRHCHRHAEGAHPGIVRPHDEGRGVNAQRHRRQRGEGHVDDDHAVIRRHGAGAGLLSDPGDVGRPGAAVAYVEPLVGTIDRCAGTVTPADHVEVAVGGHITLHVYAALIKGGNRGRIGPAVGRRIVIAGVVEHTPTGVAASPCQPQPVLPVCIGVVGPARVGTTAIGQTRDVAPSRTVELLGGHVGGKTGEQHATGDVDHAIDGRGGEARARLLHRHTGRPGAGGGIQHPYLRGAGTGCRDDAPQHVQVGADDDDLVLAACRVPAVGGDRRPAVRSDVVDIGVSRGRATGDIDPPIDERTVDAVQDHR